jgi:L-arabinose isomerase
MRTGHPLTIGLFSLGLDAYWPQFPELKQRLTAYNQHTPP